MTKGWHSDKMAHSLAARGISPRSRLQHHPEPEEEDEGVGMIFFVPSDKKGVKFDRVGVYCDKVYEVQDDGCYSVKKDIKELEDLDAKFIPAKFNTYDLEIMLQRTDDACDYVINVNDYLLEKSQESKAKLTPDRIHQWLTE